MMNLEEKPQPIIVEEQDEEGKPRLVAVEPKRRKRKKGAVKS